jgi:Fe-S oxidoreductase
VHPERTAPRFATETFRDWFARRPMMNEGKPKVLLFPDTFTNHFHTDVAQAVCEVIEAAGFQVVIPPRILCCGRPLFDYGMLGRAKKLFEQTLDTLADEIAAGVPMVVPEPSCCASFRDELTQLMPHDQQAQRLARQTFTLGEFLDKFAGDFELPAIDHKVLVQQHCHHKSIMGTDAERKVLERMHVDAEWPASGCCGLAGSWGFEKGKYEISMQCGERVLFPAVREASADTVIVADGFSCRTQIEQGTKRRAVHLAQLVKTAIEAEPARAQGPPERSREQSPIEATPANGRADHRGAKITALSAASIGAVSVAAAVATRRRAQR